MNSKSYIVVVLGIMLAKIVGFSRDIFFANFYGTGAAADIYFQIFGIVTLVFAGVGVALQTRVIMDLNKEGNSTEECKKRHVSYFLCKSILYLFIVTVIMYLFARPLTQMLLPNITGEDFELALRLTYIMIPSFLFVCVAYIISGILQNSRVFFIPSIVSLPYNIIIIASLFIPNVTIEQIGVATTIGWFLHIVIQLPDFYRKGYRFVYRGGEHREKSKDKMDFSIWWIFISNLMYQLCFLIDKTSVSGEVGQTATLNYASNLFVTISSVFVTAMSTVVFPSISKNYESGRNDRVRELIGYVLTVMFVVFVPFLLTITLFGEQIIGLVYERGEFTRESTIATAMVFTIYSFSIVGYLGQMLINKILYLASKYKYTICGTAAVVVTNVVLDMLFVPKYGIYFAAITTTLSLTVYAVMALIILYKIVGNYITKNVLANISKTLISGAAALLTYFILRLAVPEMVNSRGVIFVVPICICGVVYLAAAFALGLHKQLFKK